MHTFKHMSCDTYMEGLRQLNQMRSKELKILKFKKNKKLKKNNKIKPVEHKKKKRKVKKKINSLFLKEKKNQHKESVFHYLGTAFFNCNSK